MSLDVFTGGTKAKASEVNNNFNSFKIVEISTATDFNQSVSANGTTTASLEFTEISAANLYNADYLIISSTVTASISGNQQSADSCDIKFETKEIGGSYSDTMTNQVVHRQYDGGTTGTASQTTKTISWIHTLTAGEKSAGVQVRITSSIDRSGGAGTLSISNIQSFVKLGV